MLAQVILNQLVHETKDGPPDAGHLVLEEDPAQLAADVASFVAALADDPGR